ncbi:Mms21 [Kluyveromyces lactis]|nr:Mms21 [Kluyveromyces lactis]
MTSRLVLPDVLPITSKRHDILHQITLPDLSREISAAKSSIQDSVIGLLSSYPKYPTDRVDEINGLESAYKDLLRMESRQKFLNSKLTEMKSKYIQQSSDAPRLNRDNWDSFLNNEYNLINIRKEWIELQSEEVEIDKKDQWLRVFCALPYIWSDPTRIIPNDPFETDAAQEEEGEDIKVEGGVVELTCPVSVKKFQAPMISVKCHHTIDNESLQSLFQRGKSIQCPVSGCNKTLTARDFVADRLMHIRVLISELRE